MLTIQLSTGLSESTASYSPLTSPSTHAESGRYAIVSGVPSVCRYSFSSSRLCSTQRTSSMSFRAAGEEEGGE